VSLVLGVTGGIGSGKSTFTRKLLEIYPANVFDADLCARELLEKDPVVQRAVEQAFPETLVDGKVSREKLRDLVFTKKQKRSELEGLLHPRIREQWMGLAQEARTTGGRLIIDIPLLFETGTEKYFDATVVVGCSRTTQIQRLNNYRNIGGALAESIIAAQQELSHKISSADFVIWNESTLHHLETQTKLFAGYLRQRYG